MRLLIVASGGGHFAPALAVIETLPKAWEIQLVGRKYVFEGDGALSLEYQIAQKKGIPFATVATGRLQRRFTKNTIPSLLKLPLGLWQAKRILESFRPNVVLSFGGYLSLPFILISWLQHIPVVIHEQTLAAGLSNQIAARFAKKICISWESSSSFFPKRKTVLVGNPLRTFPASDRLKKLFPVLAEKVPLIYITGGSGGSHPINVLIEACVADLLKDAIVFHQTGDAIEFGDFDRLEKKREQLDSSKEKRYILVKHVDPDDVGELLARADVVVSRAGMGTILELFYFDKKAVLIPLPFAGSDEQQKNAQFFVSVAKGEILEQDDANPVTLRDSILRVMKDRYKGVKPMYETQKLIKKDAAENIVNIIKECGS